MRVMRPALFLHLICLGTWLGCLLVEGVIEARARRDRELLRAVSRLHRSIDLWVEIPAFSGVLASGLWLSLGAAWTSALVAKVLLGAFAILVNVACLWPVFRRARRRSRRLLADAASLAARLPGLRRGVPRGARRVAPRAGANGLALTRQNTISTFRFTRLTHSV